MSDKEQSYWKQTLLAAPAFGAKALVGDLPRGAVEQATERRLRGSKLPTVKLLSQGLRGRGGGRAIGGMVGILTAPLYLKGVQLSGSKNKSERAKGAALLGLSSSIFVGQKGLAEGFRDARVAGLAPSKALAKGGLLGLTRSVYKLPAALALGMSVAAGRNKSKDKGNPYTKFVTPALYGAAIGGLSRGFEDVVERSVSRKAPLTARNLMKSIRKAGPAVGGGVVGGMLGGLVLSGVVDAAEKAMEKKGSAIAELIALGLTHQTAKGAMGYGKIGKFFARTPGLRRLAAASNEANSRNLAIGIKEGLFGKADLGWRGGLLLGASYPELQISRGMGQNIGKLLRNVPEEYRPTVLNFLAKKVRQNPTLLTTPRGDPTPVLRFLPDAVDKALGSKPLYGEAKTRVGAALQKAWTRATLSGRGVLGGGLPVAGKAQSVSKLRDLAPSLALLGVGAPLAAGVVPLGVVAAPAGVLGAHFALGGIKGVGAHTAKIQQMGTQGMVRGTLAGVLPGLRGQKASAKAFNHLTDTLVSPALGDVEKLTASVGNWASSRVGRRAVARPTRSVLSRLQGIKPRAPGVTRERFLLGSMGAGAALGAMKHMSGGKKSK